MTKAKSKGEGVGYRRPPKAYQFKPGQSGNPKGRPKKKEADALEIDLEETFEAVFGEAAAGPGGSYEREMRGLLKRAGKDRHVPSIIHLLREMRKHGVIRPKASHRSAGRWELPIQYPYRVGVELLDRYGPGPWTPRRVRPIIEHYLATRDENEVLYDSIVGYEFDV